MANFDDFRTRNEIKIIIQDRNAENGANRKQRRKRRGALPVDRFTRTPARRKTGGGSFSLYNCGQIKTEENVFVPFPFVIVPPVALPGSIGIDALTVDDFAARATAILSAGELAETFQRIKQTESNGYLIRLHLTGGDEIEINSGFAGWTETGEIKLSAEQLSAAALISFSNYQLTGENVGLFIDLDLTGANNKITTENDYFAPSADYQLKNNDSFFLFPQFFFSQSVSTRGTTSFDTIYYYLNRLFSTNVQEIFLDENSPYYRILQSGTTGASDYAEQRRSTQFQTAGNFAPPRLFKSIDSNLTYTLEPNADNFPTLFLPAPVASPYNFDFTAIAPNSFCANGHYLFAVVRRGASYFYFWK